MKWNDPDRDAFLRMQETAERQQKAAAGRAQRKPWRERAYGGLKGWLTVKAMDAIIAGIIALIVLAVIVGIAIQ